MKTADLRKLTVKELEDALAEAKEELFNLRFQLVTNQLDNTARIKTVKKQIARIKTEMSERAIAAWYAQQEEK